ncbi:MAG: glycoside hydrolase family 3 N-terminal domain-containing protein [Bacteroidota bacterium]
MKPLAPMALLTLSLLLAPPGLSTGVAFPVIAPGAPAPPAAPPTTPPAAPRPGTANTVQAGTLPYRNVALPIPARVADLLSRMTLEEKVAQLQAVNWEHTRLYDEATRQFSPDQARKLIRFGIGQITRPGDKNNAAKATAFANAIQKYLIEQTELGVPAILHEEALHGFVAAGATSFPQAIALGATFDPPLVEEIFAVTARQMRARGVHHALAPVLDIAREPRWGRFEETYGEDPYLVSRLGVAAVNGFQGRRPAGAPIDAVHVLATGKHFAAHGQPEGGRNTAPGNLSERLIREVFFPPFEAAVREAGLATIMASYNEIDGIPSHVNHWLLGGVLRGEWGFGGLVVADYFAIAELERKHHVVADLRAAGRAALQAGVDIELPQPEGYVTLVSDVRANVVAETAVDRAVTRVLQTKMMLGLFERPYVDPALATAPERPADRKLALRAAEEAIVLLKNTGGLLPLDITRVKSLAVIGPNAAVCRLGGYSGTPPQTVSILDGIRARVGNKVSVSTAAGCGLTTGGRGWVDNEVALATAAENAPLIAEAVKSAAAADVVLLALGQNEQLSREGWADDHRGDRMTLDLVGSQTELVRAVLAVGKPTILFLSNGAPLALGSVARDVPAIMEGFYLGQETGTAVARVLFGDVSPSGKLPMTLPRQTGSIPAYYNYKPSARRLYLFEEPGPEWPFGFGLAYTTFKYGAVTVTPPRIPPTGKVTVTVTVSNTGKRAADEVVQLYVHDLVSSVTRPVQELKGFRRVHLAAGQSTRVEFPLHPGDLSFINERMQRIVEPGTFEIMAGGNSVDLVRARLEVTP